MITDGQWKILGDGTSIYTFLVHSYPKIRAKFHSEEQFQIMTDTFRHFMTTVRKTTSSLIRRIANNKVFNIAAKSIDQVRYTRELNDFRELLSVYDRRL